MNPPRGRSVLQSLSRFDSPTGFAAGVNSVTATLNARKEFLVSRGVLNEVGLEQDGIRVTEAGSVEIGEMPLGEINDALRHQGCGDLTLVPTASFRRSLGETYPALSETELNLINPAPIPRFLSDKARQYWVLHETPLPVVPWQPLDYYADSETGLSTGQLKHEFIGDAPVVVKARNATQGDDIWFYPGGISAFVEDWQEESVPNHLLEAPERFLVQYAIPHHYDRRVLAAGPTPVAGEDRYGSQRTDKSNLNLVSTSGDTLREVAAELLGRGAVKPLDFDGLDRAVERAATDLHEALGNQTGVQGDSPHTWVGWDFLVVDPGDDRLDAIPAAVRDVILDERYRLESGEYLVFGEGNLSPGSKERYVNVLANGREGLRWDSAANLLKYGESISRNDPFEPGIPDSLDVETLATHYGI